MILSILALCGAIFPEIQAHAVLLDRIEASVNSGLILTSDISKFRKTVGLRSQLDPLFAGSPLSSQGAKASSDDISKFLTDEKLISQLYPVSDNEVEQEVMGIQNSNKITRDTLKSALKTQGFDFEDYFELIRSSASKKHLLEQDIRVRVSISDEDVKNYYLNHFSKRGGATSYKVRIITVTPKNYKSPNAAKEVADRLLEDLRSGDSSFEDLAKRISDDSSAPSGGDLGSLTEDQMSPQIKEQLKRMKVGEVSGLLGTASTKYFVLKLEDITTGDMDRFNSMKEEIRNQLASAEYQHQLQLWLERQRQNAFLHRVK